MAIHIGQNGTEVIFEAGYMNRRTRRRYAQLQRRKQNPVSSRMARVLAYASK